MIRHFISENKGETFLEMVISIAIFSLTIVFVTTAFAQALNIENGTYETRQNMNNRLVRISEARLDEKDTLKELNVSADKKISYSVTRQDGTGATGSFMTKEIQEENYGFEKVVLSE